METLGKSCDVVQSDIENIHIPLAPEFLLDRLGTELNRPGFVVELLFAGDAMPDDAQIPVPKAITEKQEMAFSQLCRKLYRNKVSDVRSGQIVDVMVLGNDITISFRIHAVHCTVDFQNHAAGVHGQFTV